jgi:tRNA (Thr-GGU) A37 N-methylase
MQSTDAPKRTPVIDAKILYSDSSIASRESIEKIKRKKHHGAPWKCTAQQC